MHTKIPLIVPFVCPRRPFKIARIADLYYNWASHPGSRIYIISHKPLCLCAIFKVDKSEQVVG